MWDHVTLPLHHSYTLDIVITVISTLQNRKMREKLPIEICVENLFSFSFECTAVFIYVSSVMCLTNCIVSCAAVSDALDPA